MTDVQCRRHDVQHWDEATDEWVCKKCGNRTPVKRDKNGRVR